MLIRTKLLASAAAFVLTAGFAVADGHSEQTAETVVATVNGAQITLGEITLNYSRLPEEYQALEDSALFEALLDQMIDQQLLADSLIDEPKFIGIVLANEIRSLRANAVITATMDELVNEETLQAAYDAQFEGVESGAEYNASHILVATEEEALSLKTQVDEGADFATLAQTFSTGPSGPNGGELGWFGPGMMVPSFEEAVLTLENGGVSDPVQTQFGWHIVKLNDTRTADLPTLESMRGTLTANMQQQALTSLLADLRTDADIVLPDQGDFDASLIRNIELLED